MKRSRETEKEEKLEDSDEEDDEDYDPDKDEDEKAAQLEDLIEASKSSETLISSIQDIKRQKRVDDIWDAMKLDEITAPQKQTVAKVRNPKQKLKKGNRRTKKILGDIFGTKTAGDICKKAIISGGAEQRIKKLSKSSLKKASSSSSSSILRDKIVTESIKYAGQVIEVKKKVLSSNSPLTIKPKTSLDDALSAINGPAKLNTVTKSSIDWDDYKDHSGIGETIEKGAKNGFLAKKEFLERCDVRKFEKELEGRQQKKS